MMKSSAGSNGNRIEPAISPFREERDNHYAIRACVLYKKHDFYTETSIHSWKEIIN